MLVVVYAARKSNSVLVFQEESNISLRLLVYVMVSRWGLLIEQVCRRVIFLYEWAVNSLDLRKLKGVTQQAALLAVWFLMYCSCIRWIVNGRSTFGKD